MPPLDELAQLVASVSTGAKYRAVCPALIETIGAQELSKRRSLKEAVKATKSKLHQVAGAYVSGRINYADWLTRLQAAAAAGQDLHPICRDILTHHASTRERLPILDDFYATLLRDLPPVSTILDLACGLNPLTLPWMRATGRLADAVTYCAYDVYQDLAEFLNEFFRLSNVRGDAAAVDLLRDFPHPRADLALLLKAIPCLEQIEKSAGERLLEAIDARVVLVSFPVQSLGGRGKGMRTTYDARFAELVGGRPWRVDKYEFATELVYRIHK